MSLGQMLRIPHGVLGQVFVCVLFAIAAGVSRPWIEHGGWTGRASERARRLGCWCLLLLLAQLWVAAAMRHNYAGLAIPTFPFSTPEGALLPAAWDYRVALQFAHRVLAVVLAVAVATYGHCLWRDPALPVWLRTSSIGLVGLIALQILLGAQIIWSGRQAYVTTGHVLVGALTLAAVFVVTLFVHRDSIEEPPSSAA